MVFNRKTIASRVAAIALTGALAAGFAASAEAQRKVRWKMPSSFSSQLDVIGPAGIRIAEHVTRMSGGSFDLKFFEPNALVPPLQVFDAVSAGSVEAGYSAGGFYAGKIPAASFFSTVPFGPQTGEFLAWMKFGGGHELQDEIYAPFQVKAYPACSINAPEASGWFRKEIKSIDELKGLKMRFYGLGARVMEKFGVSTQLLAPGDIYPALELGTIDATELSMPSVDLKAGFHQVAKHYYFPGWQQQSTFHEILVNRKLYEELSDEHRTMLEVACGEAAVWSFGLAESKQFGALQEIKSKGVTIHTWPQSVTDQMEAKWKEVAAEESAKDATFKKVYESYANFRADYAIWREVGYLK
jgi:TRAP-type mannitol/chloroaromatic compound transport system substrate-binding protein